jgi:hypothetical protein
MAILLKFEVILAILDELGAHVYELEAEQVQPDLAARWEERANSSCDPQGIPTIMWCLQYRLLFFGNHPNDETQF